ncbi:hypothetical protein SAMN02745823_01411 [Sporobacter termitidis DSM 10068]|uniref:Haloacid dehalogenase-like hydrolase n=1 Tax=Sporobacter termitidis DSM 10068 TaxID=1123282 RepID=A0A1M5WVR4_9FIRM|nr:hypothetical protein [Sporobacter termitidis]SHH91550.1 hypothetical protein SAMN02745823_01411 [Sporobacter termitidis DSM 10068]
MVYAVDFDGTLCVNAFPEIGAPRHEIINFVKGRRRDGDKIILWTCRSGWALESAIRWCMRHGLEFDAVNDNLAENIASFNNNSRKVSADFYIDDRNLSLEV